MSVQSSWRRQREKDIEAVERYADQIMHDTRWDWLRGRRARRSIVIAFVVTLVATAALYVVAGSCGSITLVASIALWVATRLAVRTIADLPDELLDERQASVRDRAYRSAFVALGGFLIVTIGVLLAWVVISSEDGSTASIAFDVDNVLGLFWAVTGFCVALPSLVIAWSEPSV